MKKRLKQLKRNVLGTTQSRKRKTLLRRILLSASFVFFFSLTLSLHIFAAPPGSPYTAGETLDPSCAPGDSNCSVEAAGSLEVGVDVQAYAAKLDDFVSSNITLGANSVATASGALTFEPLAGQGVNVDLSTTGDFAVNTDDLFVDTSTGRVGIGTTTPGEVFSINGNVSIINNGILKQTVNEWGDKWWMAGSSIKVAMDSASTSWLTTFGGATGLTKFRWSSTKTGGIGPILDLESEGNAIFYGNVGIGDSTPSALFTVGSGDLFQISAAGAITAATGLTSTGVLNFTADTVTNSVINLTSTGDFIIQDGGSSIFSVTDAGTVSVRLPNTTSWNSGFAFNNSVSGDGVAWLTTLNSGDTFYWSFFNESGTDTTPSLHLRARSNLLSSSIANAILFFDVDNNSGSSWGSTRKLIQLENTIIYGDNSLYNPGNVRIAQTTDSGYRLDVLSAVTGQTASNRAVNASTTGATFDTTAGVLSSYGGYFSSTSARAAGANDLTNVGLYATASGAQNNYAAIFENGNVGIGDTTPSYRLDILADAASSYAASFTNDGNDANRYGIRIQAGADDGSSGTLIDFFDGDGTQITGNITYTTGTVAYNTTSDRRLKDNITTTTLSLDLLNRISIHDFTWTFDTAGTIQHGVIAQELYELYPSAVSVPAEAHRYWGVDYSKLTPLVIKAIQDLSLTVDGIQELEDETFLTKIREWLASATNGIGRLFVKELCVGTTCVNEEELKNLLESLGEDRDSEPSTETPPVEQPPTEEEPLTEEIPPEEPPIDESSTEIPEAEEEPPAEEPVIEQPTDPIVAEEPIVEETPPEESVEEEVLEEEPPADPAPNPDDPTPTP